MGKNTRTIQIHLNNPAQAGLDLTHTYEGVASVDMENGLHLWGEDDQLIASYQDHAWASWNVVPAKHKSTGGHIHAEGHLHTVDGKKLAEHIRQYGKRSVAFADRRDTEPTDQIKVTDLPPRDHLGRFTKRK